ncbi:MAG: hypothetical protein ACE5J3_04515, partial [Methanosarcinales archaeon]
VLGILNLPDSKYARFRVLEGSGNSELAKVPSMPNPEYCKVLGILNLPKFQVCQVQNIVRFWEFCNY